MDQDHARTTDNGLAPSAAAAADEAPGFAARAGWLGRGWVKRYGGHPVEVRLRGKSERRRLFVGGRERTAHRARLLRARPAVDVIVNVCDRPDLGEIWTADDVWRPHGEGPFGYTVAALRAEAGEVAQLLLAGKRVLVHCVAGVNRAPTLCVAILMLLEGLTARAALARVRQHRWMAFPDPWHWRALRLLEAELERERRLDGEDARSA
jgi:protein-tyrosine phosphatase